MSESSSFFFFFPTEAAGLKENPGLFFAAGRGADPEGQDPEEQDTGEGNTGEENADEEPAGNENHEDEAMPTGDALPLAGIAILILSAAVITAGKKNAFLK